MINPNLKAKDRIFEELPQQLKELMRKHLLTEEEHLNVLNEIKKKSYDGKFPVEHPKFIIVLGQTGAGKSNLTASITTQDSNLVVIDSDKYKEYRLDSPEIQKKHLVEYAYLTAPDAYQHRDEMIYDTMKNKYNILMEVATSEKQGMFIDIDKEIRARGYDVEIAVLGVSQINSLLSIHERYESQITLGLSTAKLTSVSRHDDSFTSLSKCVRSIDESDVDISVYQRGERLPYTPKKIYSSTDGKKRFQSAIEALNYVQEQDKKKTIAGFTQRFSIVQQQMLTRNAPKEQRQQLGLVLDRYEEEKNKDFNR